MKQTLWLGFGKKIVIISSLGNPKGSLGFSLKVFGKFTLG
jgi:hypothetical protein